VAEILRDLITIFIIMLFARAVLSWFPLQRGGFAEQLSDLLRRLTEWAVAPLRRVIPPVGMIDLSFMVLVFALLILRSAI
jgi:YggT family protein